MPGMSRKAAPAYAVAALSVELTAGATDNGAPPKAFRLLPYGRFKAADGSGRPAGIPEGWLLDRDSAVAIAAAFNGRSDARVIDYEHQTLNAEKNGKPAPAAGWIGALEARDDGLYAVDVEWTAAAAEMIAAKEYRFISPVFPYDRKTGQVLAVAHAALTNFAGIDGLTDLAALAAKFSEVQPQETSMNEELLEQLRWLLNMPVGTQAEEIVAQLQKLIDQLKAGPVQAAASFDLAAYLSSQGAELAALKAETGKAPDPARFVPMAQHAEVQNTLAALTAKVETAERDGLMTAALGDGRILPAQEAYWRAQPIVALKSWLDVAQPVAALAGMQNGGHAPAAGNGTQLTDAQLAVCRQMGVTPEDYAKTLAAEAV